jgi:REP element-mobilizing transposase RayT
MSWVRVWIHFVFTTKTKHKTLRPPELRTELFNHIRNYAKEKQIFIDTINGYEEHVHCLISLSRDMTISKTMQLIKGESSHWLNKKYPMKKFSWQDDYWAVSVSESHVENVRNYIKNQEEHHRYKSFAEEVDEFMKKYGWGHYVL